MKDHIITAMLIAVVLGVFALIASGSNKVSASYRAYDVKCRARGGVTLVAHQKYHCVVELP